MLLFLFYFSLCIISSVWCNCATYVFWVRRVPKNATALGTKSDGRRNVEDNESHKLLPSGVSHRHYSSRVQYSLFRRLHFMAAFKWRCCRKSLRKLFCWNILIAMNENNGSGSYIYYGENPLRVNWYNILAHWKQRKSTFIWRICYFHCENAVDKPSISYSRHLNLQRRSRPR